MNNKIIDISIVIPVKDEAGNILPLAEELTGVFEKEEWPWECIWIDDGSEDESLNELKIVVRKNPQHSYISFGKNAGKSAALIAGFNTARGNIIATIDGDGQNDPSNLPGLIKLLKSEDLDMVNGYRASRKDTSIRKVASRIANFFRNTMTGKTVRDVGCATRVFKKECIEFLPRFRGMHRFLPTFAAMYGFKLSEVPVIHRPRSRGKSKYTINNRLWVGLFDTFGVLWLRKRNFSYKIKEKSERQ